MNVHSLLPVALLALLFSQSATAVRPAADQPPVDWRDRVNARIEQTRRYMDGHPCVIESTTRVLDREGAVKKERAQSQRIYTDTEGNRVREELNEHFEVVKVEIIGGDEGEECFDLLTVFDPEDGRHTFRTAGIDEQGWLLVRFEPVGPDTDGYWGRAWIDMTDWAVVRMEFTPTDLPGTVRDLTMTATFELHPDGVWLPLEIVSNGRARLLLFNVWFEDVTRYVGFEEG